MLVDNAGDRRVLAPFATTRATRGMVASIDQLASSAGVEVMRSGGTAADAAVAASAVLAVTAQHTCGMGGDVWALVHHTPGEPPVALNASGRAGSGADPQRLREELALVAADSPELNSAGLDTTAFAMPVTGDPRSIPVPGCVDGWLALHDRFGLLSLKQVFRFAIDLAENGFVLSQAGALAAKQLVNVAHADDYFGASAGAVVRRPGLAEALRAIVSNGRSGFYEGDFGADLIELGQGEYQAHDLTMPLANWVEPLAIEAWGQRIFTVPPNSQGYLTLAAAWMADGLDLPTDIDDPLAIHLLAEAAKLAAYDRIDVLHEHANGHELLSLERLTQRQAAISADTATAVGSWAQRSGDTNYIAAVDEKRMGVSLIQSNASGWGAHLFTKTNRISLQNRGIGFSLQPGHPAEYGPNRRPPHTLAPALVQTPDGELRCVIGTMGGDNQPQVVLQLLARLLHGGDTAGEAIAAGRWYWSRPNASLFETWNDPPTLQLVLEGHADGELNRAKKTDVAMTVAAALSERGHDVRLADSFDDSFGHAHVITVESGGAAHQILTGASDPRMLTSAALGY